MFMYRDVDCTVILIQHIHSEGSSDSCDWMYCVIVPYDMTNSI